MYFYFNKLVRDGLFPKNKRADCKKNKKGFALSAKLSFQSHEANSTGS